MSERKNETFQESFNEDFCTRLEYHLTNAFEKSEDKRLKGLWCDGVSMPFIESQLTKKSVNDSGKIETKARLGFDGQGEYELIIKFGQLSLRRYANGLDLLNCLPDNDSLDWIMLDIDKKRIELQLK